MPSLSRSLEQALHQAIKLASDRHHEYATLEHLLLALLRLRPPRPLLLLRTRVLDAGNRRGAGDQQRQ